MRIGILHVDYDEPDVETYRGTYVTVGGEEVFRAVSLDAYDDEQACVQYLVDHDLHAMRSSSMDNFYLDQPE